VLSVLKLGGSVLRDERRTRRRAVPADRLAPNQDERLVVIVSAQYGDDRRAAGRSGAIATTRAAARSICCGRPASCGRSRSSRLHLQRIGVSAVPFNVHQTASWPSVEGRRGHDGAPAAAARGARHRRASSSCPGSWASAPAARSRRSAAADRI
jgi:hypothetical protein